MQIKKSVEISLSDDKFKINWDDRSSNCEFKLSIRGTDKWVYLGVELTDCVGSGNYIEDVLELREELRKEWKDHELFKLIDLVCEKNKYESLIKFFDTCIKSELDVEPEINYIKEKYKKDILDYLKNCVKIQIKYRKEYVIFSKRYNDYTEYVKEAKELLKLAINVLK